MNQPFKQRFQEATDSEIPELLEILQSHYEEIPSHQRGSYNQLKQEFFNQPNNFTLNGWKAKFLVLISQFKFEMKVPEKEPITTPSSTQSNPSPSASKAIPVIFTAFANPKGDLENLNKEQNAIQDALMPLEHKGLLKHLNRTDTDLDAYFDFLRQWKNQIQIFHYAGHANSEGISLQNAHTFFEPLAEELIDRNPNTLQLVFLNACATFAHVKTLFDFGVPAVIATSAKVEDEKAMILAKRFYHNLAKGDSIESAYKSAGNYVRGSSSEARFRFLGQINNWNQVAKTAQQEFPWGLYIREGVSLKDKGLNLEAHQSSSHHTQGGKTVIQNAEKIYNIGNMETGNFS